MFRGRTGRLPEGGCRTGSQGRLAAHADIDGLEAIERNLAHYAPGSVPEVSFRADGPSLAMRRWPKRQATLVPG